MKFFRNVCLVIAISAVVLLTKNCDCMGNTNNDTNSYLVIKNNITDSVVNIGSFTAVSWVNTTGGTMFTDKLVITPIPKKGGQGQVTYAGSTTGHVRLWYGSGGSDFEQVNNVTLLPGKTTIVTVTDSSSSVSGPQ